MEDGRSSTMPSSAERMSAPMRLVVIIVLLSSGSTSMMSIGAVVVFFLDVVRLIWVEVFLFKSCDERQTC